MDPEKMREKVDEASGLLKMLANRNRLMILCQLVEGEWSVGALAEFLDLRDTVVSQQLGLLRRDGLVKARRDGRTIYYSLRRDDACRVLRTLYDIYCVPKAE
tara:strand:- start:4914 stop:5219 length:306 start_codon:yes stop_codon:yes gene_type:complete